MTGGPRGGARATGRNFGAGMSGGIAYVLDPGTSRPGSTRRWSRSRRSTPRISSSCCTAWCRHASSRPVRRWPPSILSDWDAVVARSSCKVMPRDYKRVLDAIAARRSRGPRRDRRGDHGGEPWLIQRIPQGRHAELPTRRPVPVRLKDWNEVYESRSARRSCARRQPLHGLRHPVLPQRLPAGQPDPGLERPRVPRPLADAIERLHATNNFPEFTGRLCPAPCEAACVLGINQPTPVTIKQVEVSIIDHAWAEGWVTPQPADGAHRQAVAVVGSGPAGLAAAQQLTRAGHTSPCSSGPTASAGCCATASPSSRWRSATSTVASSRWRPRAPSSAPACDVGVDMTVEELLAEPSTRSCWPAVPPRRDLPVPGRELAGIHQAMEYLPWANKVQEGDLAESPIMPRASTWSSSAAATPAPTAWAPRTARVPRRSTQLEIMPQPPAAVRDGLQGHLRP
jgi:hypothetical protein